MAHTAPPTSSRRWLELGFGFVLLLVGALVAVVAVLALNHPHGQQAASAAEPLRSSTAPAPKHPSSSTGRPGTPASSTPPATAGKLPLIVLNNTSNTPASVAADRFRQQGWSVTDVSTFEGDILSTAAYFDPNVAGAEAAATELQREFPAIQRVKPKFDGLPDGPIVVVLTSDYS